MKGYMYILRCSNGEYYSGSTNNLELRIEEHHQGKCSNFSWKYLPVELIYSEEFNSEEEAFKREKQIQGWSRAKKEALMSGDIEKLKSLSRNHTDYKHGVLKDKKTNEELKCWSLGFPSTSSGPNI